MFKNKSLKQSMHGFLKKELKNIVKYVHKVRPKIDNNLTKNLLKKTRVKTFLNEYNLSFLKSSKLD